MISAVILAAGKSSRFLKGHKLLFEIDGNILLDLTLKKYLSFSWINKVLVVLGYKAKEILQKSKYLKDCDYVINTNYEKGLSSSVLLGLKSVSCQNLLIALGDMPFISIDLIKELFNIFRQKDLDALRPQYNGIYGFPVFFKKNKIKRFISDIKGDIGLRNLLSKLDKFEIFKTDDKTCIKDIDIKEALYYEF